MAYRYKTMKVNGKTKLVHRHLMEQKLGRRLATDEHVHHENEQRHDNSDANLELLSAAVHIAAHAERRRIYPREKPCAVCGHVFTPKPSKRKRALTCSTPCANTLRSITEKATKAIVRANVVGVEQEKAA